MQFGMAEEQHVQRAADREEAFAWWYNAGDRRSLAVTAEHFGVVTRTVEKWSAEGDWQVRAAGLDQEAAAIRDRKLIQDAARRLQLQRAAGELAVAKFVEGIRAGTITMDARTALEWAKHLNVLDGGVNERSETTTPERNAHRQAILESIADEVLELPEAAVEAEVDRLDG